MFTSTKLRAALVILLLWVFACTEAGADGVTDCPDGQIFAEQQGWWIDYENGPLSKQIAMNDGTAAHQHVGACIPINQPIDGWFTFKIRLMMHKVHGGFTADRIDIGIGPGGDRVAEKDFHMDCGNEPAMCTEVVEVPVNLSELETGRHEFRIRHLRATLGDGDRAFATGGWPICVRACEPAIADREFPGHLEGRGWIEETEYTNAVIDEDLTNGKPVVSGVWRPKVRTRQNVARSFAHVDAFFGSDNYGWTVLDHPGTFEGQLNIDTTRLGNGNHCLAIRADKAFGGGSNVGIIQIPFEVNNPGAPTGHGKGDCAPGTA
jgi:hypothetical protein